VLAAATLATLAAGSLLAAQVLGDSGAPRVTLSGADEGDCRNVPCRTLAYAFRQAQPGDVVRVEGGAYGPQEIPALPREGRAVTFRPAGRAPVRISRLAIRGDRVTVTGFEVEQLEVDPKRSGDLADRVTLRDVSGGRMYAGAVRDFEVVGGSWGPQEDLPIIQLGSGQRVVLDGLDIHDATATGPEVHVECIWAASVDELTLRNSRVRGCAYFGLFVTRLKGPDPRDVTLENNVFEATRTYTGTPAPYAINIANWVRRLNRLTLRDNTIAGAVALQPRDIGGGRIVGNIGTEAVCHPNLRSSQNVWATGSCGPADRTSPGLTSTFADPAARVWKLPAGTTALSSPAASAG
jgi:hypothetical protein